MITRASALHVNITGSYSLNAPRDRVWDLMMDPAALASCIPGCEIFEPDGPDRFRARITIGVAAMTATYEGTVVITEKIAKSSYRLEVDGRGTPGFVTGGATIALRGDDDATVVEVTAMVQTGGLIAHLGERLISAAAKMMQDRFFACMQRKLMS